MLFLFLFSACTVRQDIIFHRNGGGELHLEIRLHDMVTAYARDIYGGFSADPDEVVIFDLPAIESFFALNPSAELVNIENPAPGSLMLTARFSDVESFLDQDAYDLPPVVEVHREGGVTTVEFALSPENMSILTDPVSLTDTELIRVFGPQKERPYTEEEYLDIISYTFAEYLEDTGAEAVISSAVVEVQVKVEGRIVNISGGRIRGEDKALFAIPFIDIVTMTEPLVLSISYR